MISLDLVLELASLANPGGNSNISLSMRNPNKILKTLAAFQSVEDPDRRHKTRGHALPQAIDFSLYPGPGPKNETCLKGWGILPSKLGQVCCFHHQLGCDNVAIQVVQTRGSRVYQI